MVPPTPRRIASGCIGLLSAFLFVVAVQGQGPAFVPDGAHFPNPDGTSQTLSTTGSIDLTGPFFQSLGTNGRTCGSCHQPSDGMTVSAAHVQQRFDTTAGLDPIFRTNDGSNCNHDIDVSTKAGRSAAYSLLRTRGLIRIGITVPTAAKRDYVVVSADNQYGCTETDTVSMYRRPLPSTNLRFLSAVMWDGRESSPLTGTVKIVSPNNAGFDPNALETDLKHQSVDATLGHAEGAQPGPTAEQQQAIVDFEMALFTGQATSSGGGNLDAQGAQGGPGLLVTQPFFIGINSPVPMVENPLSGPFSPVIFNIFDALTGAVDNSPRAAIARGQAIFNSKSITITGVKGINDDLTGGAPLAGFCGTCHDTPNVGNHSFPTPLDIGTGDFGATQSVNAGGLDISYLPKITACKKMTNGDPDLGNCVTTTDLGQAAIDGKFAHIGKIKGPILRGLSSRAPYFHNGSAQTLLDVVRFYEARFGVSFTAQEESDLVAFLSSL